LPRAEVFDHIFARVSLDLGFGSQIELNLNYTPVNIDKFRQNLGPKNTTIPAGFWPYGVW
jgi:hypothetical protein